MAKPTARMRDGGWDEQPCRPWPGLLFCGGHFTTLSFYILFPAIELIEAFVTTESRLAVALLLATAVSAPVFIGAANVVRTRISGFERLNPDRGDSGRLCILSYCPISINTYSLLVGTLVGTLSLLDLMIVSTLWHAVLFAFPAFMFVRWLLRHDRVVIDHAHISRHAGSKELWRVPRDTRADYDPEAETVTLRGHAIHLRGLFRPDLMLRSLPGLRQKD